MVKKENINNIQMIFQGDESEPEESMRSEDKESHLITD